GIRDFHVTGVQTCALPICFLQARRHALRHVPGQVGRAGDLLEGLDPIGRALDVVAALVEDDVVRGDFQQVRRDLGALVPDLAGGVDERGAADRGAAAAVRPHAEGDAPGVAVDDLDIVQRHAQLLGYQLGEGRLLTLPV